MPDDKPPPRRRHPFQSSTERDHEAERKLRDAREARAASHHDRDQVSELDVAVSVGVESANSDGTPARDFPTEDTGVTQRILDDPDLYRLFTANHHTRMTFNDRLLAAMGDKPPDERMSSLEKRIRWLWRAVTVVAVPALGALVLAVKYVYLAGGVSAVAEIERKQLTDDVATLKLANAAISTRLRDAEEAMRRDALQIEFLTQRHHLDHDQPDPPPRSPAP